MWNGSQLRFQIAPIEGNAKHIPVGRSYRLVFRGVRKPDELRLTINGALQAIAGEYDEATESLTLPAVAVGPNDDLAVTIGVAAGSLLSQRDRRLETCRAMLRTFRLGSLAKLALDQALPELVRDPAARGPRRRRVGSRGRSALDGAAGRVGAQIIGAMHSPQERLPPG